MKVRISATIEEKTNKLINSILKENMFRNRSHVIEKAIEVLKKEVDNDKQGF